MKKVNIQRDLESRRNMIQAIAPAKVFEMSIETVKKEEDNAESETVPGNEDDTVATAGEKAKKRRRTSAGNLEAFPV
jgi:hypothetical protein